MYPTHDTDWAISSRGNLWKRRHGIVLTVGQKTNGCYWARKGKEFLRGEFYSQSEAKYAVEHGLDGDDSKTHEDDSFWEVL